MEGDIGEGELVKLKILMCQNTVKKADQAVLIHHKNARKFNVSVEF